MGELVANQFRIGMSRMERVVRERMAAQDVDDITTVVSGQDTTSIAMDEIANGTLGYVQEDFDEAIKDTNTKIGE